MKELLLQLCAPAGVSGAEKPAAQEAAEALSAFAQVHTDASGNVIGEIAGHGPHILLDAHIDQVGMVVTGVDAEGFLRIDKCGGIDIRTLAGHEVTVWGREPLYGVVCSTPPHLSKQEDQSITDITEMAIDIGLSAEAAREKVHPGDRVTLRRSPKKLLGGQISSPSLDDRAGVAAVLRCLALLQEQKADCRLTVVFSTQEEVGGGSAGCASFAARAEEGIAVDVSFAMTPDAPRHKCAQLGKGTMIGIAPTLNAAMSRQLEEIARKEGISYQTEVMNGKTGTNADEMAAAGAGMRMGVLSIPLRYMHMGIEVIDPQDVESTAWLLAAYILERGRA